MTLRDFSKLTQDELLSWWLTLQLDAIPSGEVTPPRVAGIISAFRSLGKNGVVLRLQAAYSSEDVRS